MSQASEAAIALVFNMRQLQRELDAAQARAYRRAASVIAGIVLPDAYVPPVLRAP